MSRHLTIALMVCLAAAGTLQAQDKTAPAPPPVGDAAQGDLGTPAPDAPQQLTAKVLEVSGQAMCRVGEEQEWKPIQAGDALPVGTMVQTGLKSSVKIQTGPNAVITVESLSDIIIGRNEIDEEKTIRTNVGKRYGKMKFNVSDAGFTNDFRVTTPTGVMAVKGTNGGLDGNVFGEHVFGDPGNGPDSIQFMSDFEVWLSANQQMSQYFPTPQRYLEYLQQTHPQNQTNLSTFEANLIGGGPIFTPGDILQQNKAAIQNKDSRKTFDKILNPPDDDSGGEPPIIIEGEIE